MPLTNIISKPETRNYVIDANGKSVQNKKPIVEDKAWEREDLKGLTVAEIIANRKTK